MNVTNLAPSSRLDWPDDVLRLDYESAYDGSTDWALLLPPKRGATWVVVIHGHGSQGDQLYTRPDIRERWLPHLMASGAGIVTPNLRDNGWMSPAAAKDLHDLLSFLRKQYAAERFVFFSGSMGGTSNLIYAVLHPEDVAAAVALCPATDLSTYHDWCRDHQGEGGEQGQILKEIADAIESAYGGTPKDVPEVYRAHSALAHAERLTMPIFVAHGTADPTIPIEQVRRLRQKCGDREGFTYREIDGGEHDSPINMDEYIYWVLDRI